MVVPMDFRTIVDIPDPGFRIGPCEELLFVGSCFATEIGRHFQEEKFRATVNPFGVMYNPASILHTIERWDTASCKVVFLTLGTNHVYRLKETGEIVDNCQKRPSYLFQEEELSVEACTEYLEQSVKMLRQRNPDVSIVLTLLLSVERLIAQNSSLSYFPAYEIVNDELRDYRFYKEDMLHPSDQAVEYIWQRLSETYLSDAARGFIAEWQPLKAALNHKPFDASSAEYKAFMDKTMLKVEELQKKYPNFAL